MKKIVYIFIFVVTLLSADIDYFQESNNTIIQLHEIDKKTISVKKLPKRVLRWYINDKGVLMGLKKSFYLLDSNSSLIHNIVNKYDLSMKKDYNKRFFLVETNTSDVLRLIDGINSGVGKLIAHPSFYKKVLKR